MLLLVARIVSSVRDATCACSAAAHCGRPATLEQVAAAVMGRFGARRVRLVGSASLGCWHLFENTGLAGRRRSECRVRGEPLMARTGGGYMPTSMRRFQQH